MLKHMGDLQALFWGLSTGLLILRFFGVFPGQLGGSYKFIEVNHYVMHPFIHFQGDIEKRAFFCNTHLRPIHSLSSLNNYIFNCWCCHGSYTGYIMPSPYCSYDRLQQTPPKPCMQEKAGAQGGCMDGCRKKKPVLYITLFISFNQGKICLLWTAICDLEGSFSNMFIFIIIKFVYVISFRKKTF